MPSFYVLTYSKIRNGTNIWIRWNTQTEIFKEIIFIGGFVLHGREDICRYEYTVETKVETKRNLVLNGCPLTLTNKEESHTSILRVVICQLNVIFLASNSKSFANVELFKQKWEGLIQF